MTVDEKGQAQADGLVLKDYWVKEISAPVSGLYMLSDEVVHIDSSKLYDGNSDVTSVNASVTVSDKPYTCEILLKKMGYTDATLTNAKALEGTGFTLFKMPEIPENEIAENYVAAYDFSKETPVRNEVKSDKDGILRFNDLPLGDYVLVETTVSNGYVKADNIIVTLTKEYAGNSDDTAYPVVVYNEPFTAPIKILKISSSDNNIKLEGTAFKVFDVNAGAYIADISYEIDDNGNEKEVLSEKIFTTDSEGIVLTDRLTEGKYKIEEISASSGYVSNKTPVTVEIKEGRENGHDENGMPFFIVTIENDPTDTYFKKTDISTKEEIPGGHFTVKETDGSIIDEWDGTGSPHHIYGLEPGIEYIFVEESAPAGYVVAEAVTFMINEDGTPTEVVMKDDYNKVQLSKQDITSKEELPGAHVQVLDEEENVIEEWITTDTPHQINRLPAGTYIFRETQAPDGYILSEDVIFEVGESAEIQTVVMYDDYTKTAFVKLAQDTNEFLSGCTLQVLDEQGNVIDEWITDGEIHYVYGLTAKKTYILHEKSATEGYECAEDITFVAGEEYTDPSLNVLGNMEIEDKEGIGIDDDSGVNEEADDKVLIDDETVVDENANSDDGLSYEESVTEEVEDNAEDSSFAASEVVTVTMVDSPLEIIPFKVDENGDNVEGAHIQILNDKGEVIYDWITGVMSGKGFKVEPGEYTLHEVEAPAGYQKFKDTKVTVKDKDVEIELVDYSMTVSVAKVNEAKENLIGSKLQVLDDKGNIADEWITDGTVHVTNKLIADKTYTLHEVSAPDGYTLAEDITFVTDSTDVKVVMTDKKTELLVEKVNPLGIGLDGAKLQILDLDGKVVYEFTSASGGNLIKGLKKGDYILHELKAPDGHVKAADIKFSIGDEKTTVRMVDNYASIIPPSTGGAAFMLMLIAIPFVFLGMLFIKLSLKRRKTE